MLLISPDGLGYDPVTRWCSRVLCKNGGTTSDRTYPDIPQQRVFV